MAEVTAMESNNTLMLTNAEELTLVLTETLLSPLYDEAGYSLPL